MGKRHYKRKQGCRAYFESLESRTLLSASIVASDFPVSIGQPVVPAETSDVNAQMEGIFRQIARWNELAALPMTPVDVARPATPPRTLDLTDLSNVRQQQMLSSDAWVVPLSRGNGVVEVQVGAVHDFRPGAQNNQYVAAALLFDSAGNTYSMQSCQFVDTGDGGYNIYVTMNVPDTAVLGDCEIEVRYGPNVDGTDADGAGGTISFDDPGALSDPGQESNPKTFNDKLPVPVVPPAATNTRAAPGLSSSATSSAPVSPVTTDVVGSLRADPIAASVADAGASVSVNVDLSVSGLKAADHDQQGHEEMRSAATPSRWPPSTGHTHRQGDDVLADAELDSPLAP